MATLFEFPRIGADSKLLPINGSSANGIQGTSELVQFPLPFFR